MIRETPCDWGDCPYNAMYSEDCRYYCGLGVDEDSYPDEDEEATQMKLWVDDVRPAPKGYVWCNSVNDAINTIKLREARIENILREYTPSEMRMKDLSIQIIDIDHDAGEYAQYGGDYIKLLDWLEETGRNYPIRIHSMNPVGVQNMRTIIQRNGWTEVK